MLLLMNQAIIVSQRQIWGVYTVICDLLTTLGFSWDNENGTDVEDSIWEAYIKVIKIFPAKV
jgi:hypothetical protein